MENENKGQQQEVVEMSDAMRNLASSLEGVSNANAILTDTGKEAVEKGVIKIKNVDQENVDNEAPESEEKKPAKVNGKTTEKKVETPTDENSSNEDDNQEDEDDDEIEKNPLLKSVKGKKENKNEVVLENFDQIKEHAKKTLGITVKSEKDMAKVFSSATKWREDAAKVPDLIDKVEKLEELFQQMPSPLLNSVKAFFDGDADWDKQIVNRPKFDYTKPVEKQDTKMLVNHYYPNKFTDADWNETDVPQALEIAISSAKTFFAKDKMQLEKESADMVTNSQNRLEAVKSSITGSLKSLSDSFPDLDQKGIKEITKVLESGDINSLFYDKKGVYKSDAAEKLLMAMYGKDTIKSMMKVSAKRAESKANEDILSRGADKPKPNKGGGSQKDVVDEKTEKAINALIGGLNKTKTY